MTDDEKIAQVTAALTGGFEVFFPEPICVEAGSRVHLTVPVLYPDGEQTMLKRDIVTDRGGYAVGVIVAPSCDRIIGLIW